MNRASSGFLRKSIFAMGAVFVILFVSGLLADYMDPNSPPTDIIVLSGPTSTPGGLLSASYEIISLECSGFGEVISATIELKISGGIPPYLLEFDPGNPILAVNSTGIRFTLAGGASVVVKIKSTTPNGEPQVLRDIFAPAHRPECENPTPTPTASSSPTPTYTSTSTATPTMTNLATFISPTKKDDGSTNNTTVNTTIAPTTNPTINATIAPTTNPTTNATIAPTTNPTTNATIAPTTNPTINPTETQSFSPRLVECRDNRDNDGDGYIDLQDPQCSSTRDNDESR